MTAYNHMSGFGRGIAEGARVIQGQTVVISANLGWRPVRTYTTK